MKELYELMKKNKLTSFRKIYEFCNSSKPKKVVETSMEAFAITNKNQDTVTQNSLFNFSASLTLSGGDYPCESLSCRISRVGDLARFASLYSDRTTIYNPFDFVYFFFYSHGKHEMSPGTFIGEAINAFSITLALRPLIERGLIVYSKTLYVVCANCKKKRDKIINSLYGNLDKIASKTILPVIQEEVGIEYEKKSFHLVGSKFLIGEDIYIHYKKFPNFLIQNGKRIKNLERLTYTHPLIQKLTNEAIDSLMFQKLGSLETLTQTYLTTNMIEKTLLVGMGKQVEDRALNLFANGLSVIQDVPYQNVIDLRDRHSNEFKSFQTHVSELIRKAKTFETQSEFDTYVNTELGDELKDLKKIQKEGKKKLALKGFAGGAFLGASIIVSALTNSGLPGLVGLAKACYDCAELVEEASDIKEKIQESPLFFYYKLESVGR